MNLHELQPFEYKILEKQGKPGVLCTIGGVFQRADTKNANGRVYTKELWNNLLTKEELKERLESKQMVGMFGHPQSGLTDELKISHVITRQELRPDNTVYGEAEILDTPAGRVVETLFKAGVKLGISSRGDGSIEKKGGHDEVQKDYRLETYDFVLKPSTPGAYPSIVENIEENEKLIVGAIEGLVNSEIPADKRVPVLTECLQILSVLESANTSDQVKSISSKIQEVVQEYQTPLAMVSANPDAPLPIPYQEDPIMPNTGIPQAVAPAASLDPTLLTWHQDQIKLAVDKISQEKDEEIRALKDTVVKAQREQQEFSKKLKAAESLIDEFQTKIKGLEEGDTSVEYTKLKERYDAAVELLDEAIKRLPEIGQLKRRNEAVESLLQASIDKFKEEKVDEAIAEHMAKIPESMHESVRPLMTKCQTPEQVAETFKALMAVAPQGNAPTPRTEPLPPRQVNEGQKPTTPQPQPQRQNFAESVNARLLRAV